MSDTRLQYLEALEIPVWVGRRDAAEADLCDAVQLGPGTSARMFVCADRAFSSGALAADLMRTLPEPAVWAWPADSNEGLPISEVIDERLLTSITVFGDRLGRQLFGATIPATLGTARVVLAPEPEALTASGGARREMWRSLVSHGITADS